MAQQAVPPPSPSPSPPAAQGQAQGGAAGLVLAQHHAEPLRIALALLQRGRQLPVHLLQPPQGPGHHPYPPLTVWQGPGTVPQFPHR